MDVELRGRPGRLVRRASALLARKRRQQPRSTGRAAERLATAEEVARHGPDPALAPERRITDLQIAEFMRKGYVVVHGVLAPEELEAMQAEADLYYPPYDEWASKGDNEISVPGGRTFDPRVRAPFFGSTLMRNAYHPALVAAAARILGRRPDEVLLHQSNLSVKYSSDQKACVTNHEQPLHSDIVTHDLAYPSPDPRYWQIEFIIYLDDVPGDEFGPTKAVSWELTRDIPLAPDQNLPMPEPGGRFNHLYEQEEAAIVPAGSILIYSMRTFHRGTRIRVPRTRRRVHFVTFGPGRGDAAWIGYEGQTLWQGINHPAFKELLTSGSPQQRAVLGFPKLDSPYWNDETIDGVKRRFPEMDMGPYEVAMARRSGS
ncbi:MAG: phytanoyl-CoA dioxygenase family protein [Acidimicrobiales bacterium]|nr:phytanoyl-CoA dioxygenase family protein [Acidimicrobiales bacterium]